MNTQTQIGAGDVEIELNGKKVVLKQHPKAGIRLSRWHSGLTGLQLAVSQMKIDAITETIGAGTGRVFENQDDFDDLAIEVYETGVMNLFVDVGNYISIMMNGGRPLVDTMPTAAAGKGRKRPQLNA